MGPRFLSSLLWYRPAITPMVIAALLAAIIAFALAGPVSILRQAWHTRSPPTASEGHMELSLGGWTGDHQVLDETVELAAYLFRTLAG